MFVHLMGWCIEKRSVQTAVLLLLLAPAACGDASPEGSTAASGATVLHCTDAGTECRTLVFRGRVTNPAAVVAHTPTLIIPNAYIEHGLPDLAVDRNPAIVGSVALEIPASACELDPAVIFAERLSMAVAETGVDWSKYMKESRRIAAATFPVLDDPRSKLQYQELESYPNWHARRRYLNDAPQDVGFVFIECTHPAARRQPDAIVGKCRLTTTSIDGLTTTTIFRESRLEQWT